MTPIRILAGAAGALLIAGATQAAPYNAGGLPADQAARIDNACSRILGTERGEEHYAACVDSLSGSLRSARMAPTASAYREDESAGRPRSYFQGSPSDVHRREGQACASVGFDPAYQGYDSCAADLSSSMFATDHPLN